MAAGQVLAELCLSDFEPAFGRLGVESLEQLAQVRYEELLEMGLSKVQCHLFIAKVSSLAAPSGSASLSDEVEGALRVVDVQDMALAEQLANCVEQDEGLGILDVSDSMLPEYAVHQRQGHGRRAALRQQMPPPIMSSPAPEAPLSRKRAHSSHLSTAAARGGSSHISTAERRTGSSASGSSSSSLHQDVRVKKRRVFERHFLRCDDAPRSRGPAPSCRSGSAQRGFLEDRGVGDEADRERRADEEMPAA
mmetsp:Transcript_28058/g.63551  ORF Transcript_28058/g.63551 Transcript_28058/m.63551 type:complete len:250 (+) Transcript_28058:45-794(+)